MSSFTIAFKKVASCRSQDQGGYVIVTILVIVLITGILLSMSTRTAQNIEITAGHAIQYSRAMEAAEGGISTAQKALLKNDRSRQFADSSATDGVFSKDSVVGKWWKDSTFSGDHKVDTGILLGVAASPRYLYEQIGEYVSDGGTGVVNMDLGGASYGQTSAGALEVILYKVKSQGVGSESDIPRAIESTIIVTK